MKYRPIISLSVFLCDVVTLAILLNSYLHLCTTSHFPSPKWRLKASDSDFDCTVRLFEPNILTESRLKPDYLRALGNVYHTRSFYRTLIGSHTLSVKRSHLMNRNARDHFWRLLALARLRDYYRHSRVFLSDAGLLK